jgi:carbon storage regulator
MLVLSRQRDETIMIGDDIEVTVVDIRGDKVRLGINAPKEISVHRKEVYDAIRRENRAAAQVQPGDLPGSMGKIGPQKNPPPGAPRPPQQQPPQQQQGAPPPSSPGTDNKDQKNQ